MPVTQPARSLRSILLLPLVFAACSGSPNGEEALTSAEGILRYIPADTPYVFAATAPMPREVHDKLAPHIQPLVRSYGDIFIGALNQQPDDDAEALDDETRERMSSLIRELVSMITPEGIPGAGIDFRTSTGAFYGVGLLPVVRITLTDGDLFESTIARIENEAGAKMTVADLDGHPYRYAGDDDGRVILAVLDDQLVVSLVPGSLPDASLRAVLGIDLPAENIGDSGDLAALAGKYDFRPYGLGMLDVQRITASFLDDQAGVNKELLALVDYDPSALTEICKAEIRSLAGIVPRIASGYTEVTGERLESNTVFELRSDIAAGVKTLTAPVPGLGQRHKGLISFGMSLNMLAARELYSARLDTIEADPYECELLADLQDGVAGGRELLNQPIPPIAYGFRGFLAVVNDITGMDIANRQPPTDIDMTVLLATDNAAGLLAMAALFSPEIASMNLKPDSKPVKLDLPPVAAMVDTAYVAMSGNAIALSVGNGSEAGLEGMLAAAPGEPSPFMSMDMDAARYYAFIGDAMDMADVDDQPPETVRAQRELMQALGKMFDRISFDVIFTDRGIEVPSTMELAR